MSPWTHGEGQSPGSGPWPDGARETRGEVTTPGTVGRPRLPVVVHDVVDDQRQRGIRMTGRSGARRDLLDLWTCSSTRPATTPLCHRCSSRTGAARVTR